MRKSLKRIVILCNSLIIRILQPIMFLFPLRKRIIFIGYSNSFQGNSKHLYEYMKENTNLNIYFVTNSEKVLNENNTDKNILYYYKIKTKWYLMTSKVIVSDSTTNSITNLLSFRAKKVQLWHGNGMKEIVMLQMTKKFLLKQLRLCLSYLTATIPKYDLVYFTSKYSYEMRKKAFRFKQYNLNGQPRNDTLFDKQTSNAEFNVLYVPTWRESKEYINNFKNIDYNKIDEYCISRGIKFTIKLHPEERNILDFKSRFENIILMDKKEDIYEHLQNYSILITDYSSIYFDYLLLDKPIIFFPFDKEDYFLNQRGIVYDYDDITPGPHVYTTESLINKIDDVLINKRDDYKEERIRVRNLFYKYQDNKSRERASNDILELMGIKNEKV